MTHEDTDNGSERPLGESSRARDRSCRFEY